jgi:hypothetical protein
MVEHGHKSLLDSFCLNVAFGCSEAVGAVAGERKVKRGGSGTAERSLVGTKIEFFQFPLYGQLRSTHT